MSERTLRLAAPAKINLTLDVQSPRPDGFHDLDSVVMTVWPADKIVLTLRDSHTFSISCHCSDPNLPTDEKNLAVRAALLFAERFGLCVNVTIQLEKRLPAQAGLGGGSSDAATVLQGLQVMTNGVATDDDIRLLAAQIGSDVSLFLSKTGLVRMQGRGERVTPLQHVLPLHGILVRPHVGVPTAPAYRLLDELPRTPGTATPRLLSALSSAGLTPDALATLLSNDFEDAVLPAFLPVREAHQAVRKADALRALLCGSGSCVFGLARDAAHARQLFHALRGRFPFVRRARGFVR